MAGEGGTRKYWPMHMGVNLSNGNLFFSFGADSCATCGGGPADVYPKPQATSLNGPVLVFNSLGTPDTDLGPKWMSPYHASMTVDGSGNVTLIDADGSQRVFTKNLIATPQTYTADKEDAVLIDNGTDYTLTRFNGDQWVFGMSDKLLKTITARTAHVITIARDPSHRIDTITDGFGRVAKFLYVSYCSGPTITRLNEIRELAPGDVGFQSSYFQYDSAGKLTSFTNAEGETTRFEYDGSSRLSKAYDGHGNATTYTYDGSNRITNVQDPAGKNTGIAYAGSTTTVTNRLSKATAYTFDGSGRLTNVTDALNNLTDFTWDGTTWEMLTMLGPKIPVSITPWSRHKTIYTYNAGANQHELQKREVKKITNTDSVGTLLAKDEWTYNAQHDILTHKNPLDKTTTYTYQLDASSNSVGLVLTIVNPLTQTILTNTYDTAANKYRLLTSKNGVNQTTTYAYNQNTASSYGAPDKITTPSGKITNLKVDVRGRIYEVTDPSGNTEKREYDALDRLIRTINPDGTARETLFDCCHVAAELDENQHGVTYEYDLMGRKSKEVNPNGDATSYGYNDEGWLTSRTDPRGKVTTWSYDDIGRVLEIDYPGTWQEIITYYEPGMVKTKQSKKGASTSTVNYFYDDLYRLNKKTFPSGPDWTWTYDAGGRRTNMTDASGEKRYYYDDADRLTKIEQGPASFVVGTNQNYVLEYTWNAATQRTQTKLTVRTIAAKTWDYTYLADGQMDTATNPDSDVTTHQFLDDGRLKKIILSSTATREYFYEDTSDTHVYVAGKNKHLRKTLDKTNGGSTISSFSYELDAAGIRLSVTDKDSKYTPYGYDPAYQLKSDTKWSAKTPGTRTFQYAYAYDSNGNRLTQHFNGVLTSYTYGDNNELTAAGSDTFTYDQFGNMATKVSGATTTTFSYNFERHLTSVADGTSTDTHEYDSEGHRMRSKLNNASDWTNFVHDEVTETLLAEYTLISSVFTIKSLNTWTLGLISTNREGTKRLFHFDGVGSTAALTDTSQTVQDTYVYSAFGVLESSTGSSANPFRFCGMWGYYDDGARGSVYSMLLLGIRMLAVALGRMIQLDREDDGNRYTYVGNQPTMAEDSSGEFLQFIIIGIILICVAGCSSGRGKPKPNAGPKPTKKKKCKIWDKESQEYTACGFLCKNKFANTEAVAADCHDCCVECGVRPDKAVQLCQLKCEAEKKPPCECP